VTQVKHGGSRPSGQASGRLAETRVGQPVRKLASGLLGSTRHAPSSTSSESSQCVGHM
jgi:hypothetical protein